MLVNMSCNLGLHTKALGACCGLLAFGHSDASKVLCWDLGGCMNMILNFTRPFSHSAGAFGLCTFVVEPIPQNTAELYTDFVPISLEKTGKRSCSADTRYVLCNTIATCCN